MLSYIKQMILRSRFVMRYVTNGRLVHGILHGEGWLGQDQMGQAAQSSTVSIDISNTAPLICGSIDKGTLLCLGAIAWMYRVDSQMPRDKSLTWRRRP